MIEFGGIYYYIDLDNLDRTITSKLTKPTDKITLTEEKEVTDDKGNIIGTEKLVTTSLRDKEIDVPKYETIRLMLEKIIDDEEEYDTTLGVDRALDKTSLSYRLAFNTLCNYGILKEKE